MKKFLAAGAKNDDMSSLKVPAGCKAVANRQLAVGPPPPPKTSSALLHWKQVLGPEIAMI